MNNVNLIGRICKEIDLKFVSGSGLAIAKFTIAVNRQKKEGKQEADFINCIAFGKRGEVIAEYMGKGSQIGITGSLKTGSYDGKDGIKRYTTDVIVNEITFIDKKKEGTQQNSQDTGWSDDMTPVDDGDIPF